MEQLETWSVVAWLLICAFVAMLFASTFVKDHVIPEGESRAETRITLWIIRAISLGGGLWIIHQSYLFSRSIALEPDSIYLRGVVMTTVVGIPIFFWVLALYEMRKRNRAIVNKTTAAD